MRVTSTKEEHLSTLSHSQLKTFLFGPVEDVTGSIIKKVTVGYLADTTLGAERDITYTVTPRAVKDYDGDGTTYVSDNIDLTTQIIPVGDSSDLAVGTYIYVDQEEMFISKIDGNTLTVKRLRIIPRLVSTSLELQSIRLPKRTTPQFNSVMTSVLVVVTRNHYE